MPHGSSRGVIALDLGLKARPDSGELMDGSAGYSRSVLSMFGVHRSAPVERSF